MPTTDLNSFVRLLDKGVDTEQVVDFLAEHGVTSLPLISKQCSEVDCSQHGFEVQLAVDTSPMLCGRVKSFKFYSPFYCIGKKLRPYQGTLIDELRYPLTRSDVRAALGMPSAHLNGVYRYDQYNYPGHVLTFYYPTLLDDVVFVTLESAKPADHHQALSVPMRPAERLAHLSGQRKANWLLRMEAYEKAFGPALQIFRRDIPAIDVVTFQFNSESLILVTNGASDEPMYMPSESAGPSRVELQMYVKSIVPDIVMRLVQDAAFPLAEKSYLGHGDTINWMAPIVSGSLLTADLIIYSVVKSHRELQCELDGEPVQLLWTVPITDSELEYKKSRGIAEFLKLLDRVRHPMLLDVFRPSYV